MLSEIGFNMNASLQKAIHPAILNVQQKWTTV